MTDKAIISVGPRGHQSGTITPNRDANGKNPNRNMNHATPTPLWLATLKIASRPSTLNASVGRFGSPLTTSYYQCLFEWHRLVKFGYLKATLKTTARSNHSVHNFAVRLKQLGQKH